MTEADFLALPVEEQNALVAPLVGWKQVPCDHNKRQGNMDWERDGDRYSIGGEMSWCGYTHEAPRLVNGSWAEFGNMWESLTRDDEGLWRLVEDRFFDGAVHKVTYSVFWDEHGPNVELRGDAETPNPAVAIALLKSKGVIQEDEE